MNRFARQSHHRQHHSNHNNNNGRRRHAYPPPHHQHHHHHNNHNNHQQHESDEQLARDISGLHVRFSVKGMFISKPYDEKLFHDDGSFSVNLHCQWNLEGVANDGVAYNVYILPSNAMNRKQCVELEVEHTQDSYHQISRFEDDQEEDSRHGELRIYPMQTPLIETANRHKSQTNGRKRGRSELEDVHDDNAMLMMMSASAMNKKRRKLNPNLNLNANHNHNHNRNHNHNTKRIQNAFATEHEHEEKEELEYKQEQTPQQELVSAATVKRFKQKASNRKPHKIVVQRHHNRRVSLTADKTPARYRANNAVGDQEAIAAVCGDEC